jgi:DNA-binding NarL/FixJ family response regulator
MNKFRILIADDNDLIRRFVAQLIQESGDIEIIGEASDGCATVEMAKQLMPDAVLMDINMPKMNGIEASRAIHSEFPKVQVIGLSMLDKSEIGREMSEAGAVACFCKNDPWDEIIAGIHQVLGCESAADHSKGAADHACNPEPRRLENFT